MFSFLKSKSTLITALAVLVCAGWVANTDETFFQQPTHFNATPFMTVPISYSHNTSGVTATSGGGQSGAYALTKENTVVSTVATTADSVKLPTAYNGAHMVVENKGANTLAVFPATSGTIDGGSANASVSVPAGNIVEFWGTSATDWASSLKMCVASGAGSFTTLAASGAATLSSTLAVTSTTTLAGANLTMSSLTAGATAASGGAQGGSGAITTLAIQATTVATSNDSLTLPATTAGRVEVACNGAASNTMKLYPPSGSHINKETQDTAVTLAAGECALCFGFSTTAWGCVIGVAN